MGGICMRVTFFWGDRWCFFVLNGGVTASDNRNPIRDDVGQTGPRADVEPKPWPSNRVRRRSSRIKCGESPTPRPPDAGDYLCAKH